MKHLYCPWRSSYSTDKSRIKQEDANEDECVFCDHIQSDQDEQNLVVKRYDHNLIILNKFPYNAGHLLVIPYDHVSDLTQLSEDARHEMMELTTKATTILREILSAQGINVGMNLGKAGGAGIPSHVHMHVLPRYTGDTNFIATLAETKNISFDLKELYNKLQPHF